jgi:hypothetical protein
VSLYSSTTVHAHLYVQRSGKDLDEAQDLFEILETRLPGLVDQFMDAHENGTFLELRDAFCSEVSENVQCMRFTVLKDKLA